MKQTFQSLTLATAILATGSLAIAQTPATPDNSNTVKNPSTVKNPNVLKVTVTVTKTTSSKTTATNPQRKPGWVVVEEWVLWPLHREPHKALAETSVAFRRGDEA